MKFKKAGLLDDAEHKFRHALARDKKHVPSALGLGALLRQKNDEYSLEKSRELLQQVSGQVAGQADVSHLMRRTQSVGGPIQRTSSLSLFGFKRAGSTEGSKLTLKSVASAVAKDVLTVKAAGAFADSAGKAFATPKVLGRREGLVGTPERANSGGSITISADKAMQMLSEK